MKQLAMVVLAAAMGLWATAVRATDIYVSQSDPAAKDDNPGTLASPLKTIQAGLDKAQAGDTVQVRAGVYHESVVFKHGGSYGPDGSGGAIETWSPQNLKWLTLEAYKDEHVVLDGSLTIPADKWELVNGRKNTYCTPFTVSQDTVKMLFCGDKMVMPTLGNVAGKNFSLITEAASSLGPVMPGDAPTDEGYYYDPSQKKLFVNLCGRVPGKDAQVTAAQLIHGVDATHHCFVRVRKFEVRNFNGSGISVYNDQEFVVEDNHVHHCDNGISASPSGVGVVRHNTIHDIMGCGLGFGGVRGTILEENVVVRTYLNPYKVIAWAGPSIICNNPLGLIVRNNVVADTKSAGFWEDCGGAGLLIYGNTTYDMEGCGYYIEASTTGTVLRWNTVFGCSEGIVFRQNWANTAFENYLFRNLRSGLAIGSCDQDGLPKAGTMVYNWVIDNGVGSSFCA